MNAWISRLRNLFKRSRQDEADEAEAMEIVLDYARKRGYGFEAQLCGLPISGRSWAGPKKRGIWQIREQIRGGALAIVDLDSGEVIKVKDRLPR